MSGCGRKLRRIKSGAKAETERGRKSVGILQFPVIFSPVTSDEYFIRGLYRCNIHWIFIK